MSKKLLTTFFLFFVFLSLSTAQLYLKLSQFKFTEDFGIIYKSTPGIEVGYRLDSYGDKLQLGSNIGFVSAKPKLASFPGYAIRGNPTLLVPTSATYRNLSIFLADIYAEYKILNKVFSPFLKTGFTANFAYYEFEKGGFASGNEIVEVGAVGFTLGAGISYDLLDYLQIRVELSKNNSIAAKPMNSQR